MSTASRSNVRATKGTGHNWAVCLLALLPLLLSRSVHGARPSRAWTDDGAEIGASSSSMEKRLEARYPQLFHSSWNKNFEDGGTDLSSGVSSFKTKWSHGAPPNTYTPTLVDSSPLTLNGGTGHQAALCVCEKAGSTRWKQLLHLSMSGKLLGGPEVHAHRAGWLPETFATWEHEILDPKRMRFMLVRNPYSKVLSAFLDKCVHNAHSDIPCPGEDNYYESRESFTEFVKALYGEYVVKNNSINSHFTPLVDHCGLPSGFKYHFYLKSEEVDVWYPEFISYLDIEHAVSSGWARKEGDQDCFHRLSGKTCDETYQAIMHHVPEIAAADGAKEVAPAWAKHSMSAHASGADLHLQEYYTEETVEMVSKMFEGDLKEFGYEKLVLTGS